MVGTNHRRASRVGRMPCLPREIEIPRSSPEICPSSCSIWRARAKPSDGSTSDPALLIGRAYLQTVDIRLHVGEANVCRRTSSNRGTGSTVDCPASAASDRTTVCAAKTTLSCSAMALAKSGSSFVDSANKISKPTTRACANHREVRHGVDAQTATRRARMAGALQ